MSSKSVNVQSLRVILLGPDSCRLTHVLIYWVSLLLCGKLKLMFPQRYDDNYQIPSEIRRQLSDSLGDTATTGCYKGSIIMYACRLQMLQERSCELAHDVSDLLQLGAKLSLKSSIRLCTI
ncbi:hypothetical protein AgCh_003197 [Apium graveolens]